MCPEKEKAFVMRKYNFWNKKTEVKIFDSEKPPVYILKMLNRNKSDVGGRGQ